MVDKARCAVMASLLRLWFGLMRPSVWFDKVFSREGVFEGAGGR